MCKRDESPSFTVKKAGKYPCIKAESLKFLAILHFLAPGYNLKCFFKAFDANEERVSSPMTILYLQNNLTRHHSHPMKLSTLLIKGCNFLEEDYATSQKLIDQGKSEQEALQILRLQEVPKTGPENYTTFGTKISG